MFWYFKKHTRMTKSLFLHALPFPHRHCKCYSDYRTDQRRHNPRPDNPCRIYTSILTPIGNDIDWNELQRRNI